MLRCFHQSRSECKVKLNVKSALKILLKKYHSEEKFIGIYWPLHGEVDITFIKNMNNLKTALPHSSKTKGINYYNWLNNQLKLDSNRIPAPIAEIS